MTSSSQLEVKSNSETISELITKKIS